MGSLCPCRARGLAGTVFAHSKCKPLPPFAAKLEQGQFPSPVFRLKYMSLGEL